jgi:hypothetical protein
MMMTTKKIPLINTRNTAAAVTTAADGGCYDAALRDLDTFVTKGLLALTERSCSASCACLFALLRAGWKYSDMLFLHLEIMRDKKTKLDVMYVEIKADDKGTFYDIHNFLVLSLFGRSGQVTFKDVPNIGRMARDFYRRRRVNDGFVILVHPHVHDYIRGIIMNNNKQQQTAAAEEEEEEEDHHIICRMIETDHDDIDDDDDAYNSSNNEEEEEEEEDDEDPEDGNSSDKDSLDIMLRVLRSRCRHRCRRGGRLGPRRRLMGGAVINNNYFPIVGIDQKKNKDNNNNNKYNNNNNNNNNNNKLNY